MDERPERGENYIADATPVDGGVGAGKAAKGLDFPAEKSVNPKDLTEGGPHMYQEGEEAAATLAKPNLTSVAGLEHLFKGDDTMHVPLRTGVAISYLRVSTTRQLNTAADLDEDGNSIATQREWAIRKAKELGVPILREFVEPGQSAQTIDKRPEFKKLLRFVDANPDVRYVVIYMRSRVFRNHLDAAITKRQLRDKGVELISAKENFGDGYMGDAMEAITDVVNELQVRMSGEDIRIKMAHKVERGGSVGRAKLGYLNVRKDFDGRLVNTIDVDPVRAPLIIWAFEQYATNQFSITQLQMMLEDQGLTTRQSSKRAAKPLSSSQLAMILRDPYYTGVIRYKGKLHPGRHTPLISKELFLAVQKILDGRNRKGDRDRIHFHFLRGLLYCAECKSEGRTSRLVYSQNKGHGGTYEYYVCTAKQRGHCSMPSARLDELEDEVARRVAAERFDADDIASVREEVRRALVELQAADQEEKDALRTQLKKLEAQEERLIELAADGTIAVEKLRQRLEYVTLQKGAITEKLTRTVERIRHGVDKAFAFVDLLEDPAALYKQLPDNVRRELLTAFFTRLDVQVTDREVSIGVERTELNAGLHDWRAQHRLSASAHTPAKEKRASRIPAEDSLSDPYPLTQSKGLNKPVLVDHILDGTSVTHHGGPVAGDPSGHPVQLIFWGDWWNQADGAARRALFEQRVQDLLETPYFHELEQYGVHAPVWRGSTTVTRPGPPGTISVNGAMTASLDLIDDLIDDDVFPDPDDGARFAFLVLMPPGFVIQDANPANGAHYYDYDQDGPFDRDNYWAGWIRYFDPAAGENPEDTMRTLSHELVELLTDPEGDGWHTERGGGSNEVSDAGQSPGIGYQTAVVGGARVQSYWSQSRNRTVLPLEPGYSARLSAVTHETARRDLDSGTFRPEAGQLAFCVADREYWWKTEEIDQRVTVTLATRLFHSPKVTWRIAGQEVSGSGRIRVSTTIDGFNGRDSLLSPAVVAIDYEVQPDRLILNVPSPGGSFDFDVACTVRDGQITGRTQSEPTSSPAVNVGLQGAIIELDPSYSDQVEACLKELIGRWKQGGRPFRKPRPGDPIDQLGGLLTSTLPAYTSGIEYARARMVEQAAHAAAIVLAPEEAASYVRGALTLVPTSRTRLPAGELMRVVGVRQAAYAALKAQRAREAGTSG